MLSTKLWAFNNDGAWNSRFNAASWYAVSMLSFFHVLANQQLLAFRAKCRASCAFSRRDREQCSKSQSPFWSAYWLLGLVMDHLLHFRTIWYNLIQDAFAHMKYYASECGIGHTDVFLTWASKMELHSCCGHWQLTLPLWMCGIAAWWWYSVRVEIKHYTILWKLFFCEYV